MMKVYSPSSTKTYAFCPMARSLQQQRYTSKYAGKKEVAKWMGTAMAAGLETINRYRKDGTFQNHPFDNALAAWQQGIDAFRKAGGVVTDETFESRIPPLLSRALDIYSRQYPLPNGWQIHSVEHVFEHGGNARADLIVIDEDGYAPVDYKMKESLYVKPGETRDAARARTLLEYDNDWQLKHYIWAIRRFLGQPCNHYYIVLGELSPRATYTLQRFNVSERVMQQWTESAYGWWGDMYDTDSDYINVPRMSPVHDNKYGKCEFYDACITYELDPVKFQHKYIQVERRR